MSAPQATTPPVAAVESWQREAVDRWQRWLAQNRLPHAVMLTGPVGVGKRRLAQALAAQALCQEPVDGQACGHCRACELLAAGTHPDTVFTRPEQGSAQIRVDQIRTLIHALTLTPRLGSRRVALIQPADAMNENAANALLKTLEEPGAAILLLLVTAQPQRLPATVRSRCQILPVALPATETARAWLRDHAPDAAEGDRDLALALAADAPCRALELLVDGVPAVGREVRDRLAALAAGEVGVSEFGSQWGDAEDPGLYWQLLAFWCHQAASGSIHAAGLPEMPLAALIRLHERALRGLADADSGLRQDLQFQEWLLEWRSHA